jgi:hypothetical protein
LNAFAFALLMERQRDSSVDELLKLSPHFVM